MEQEVSAETRLVHVADGWEADGVSAQSCPGSCVKVGPTGSALFSRTALLDLLQRAAGEDGAIKLGAFDVPRSVNMLVAVLDEQPALPLAGTNRALSRLD